MNFKSDQLDYDHFCDISGLLSRLGCRCTTPHAHNISVKTHQMPTSTTYQVLSISPIRSSALLFLTTMFRIEATESEGNIMVSHMYWSGCLPQNRVLSVSLNSGTDFFCESVSLTLYVHNRTRRKNGRGGGQPSW